MTLGVKTRTLQEQTRPAWRNAFVSRLGVQIVLSELRYLKMIKAAGLGFSIITNKAALPIYPFIGAFFNALFYTLNTGFTHPSIFVCMSNI